ncbi:hypothetical protein BDQ12DRAFT_678154 [Crucibulum laeve]|uniref:alpha-1,6-mannosyl-glycoprotein 6-beta-N-acetylglucosaminyltransferase n=1 Tax=Crucibulum laeve TaxID=68775 RepID=A0A5C3M825_9AGAR|nr:hypothetical protein BDQ12DRAFT_678154 [Crucibulum laeve]
MRLKQSAQVFLILGSLFCITTLLYFVGTHTEAGNRQLARLTLKFGDRLDQILPFKDKDPPSPYTSAASKLESLFSPPHPSVKIGGYHQWNAQSMRDLDSCILLDNCGPNQKKVALLAAHWFEESLIRGFRGGEGIWAMSVYKNLHRLGYTTLFATSYEEALYIYRSMPDLIKVVIRNQAGLCHLDPQCIKSPSNPTGIPAWKLFEFEYFPQLGGQHDKSRMQGKWILSAMPAAEWHKGNDPIQYIGFAIEDDCAKMPVVPLSERPNRLWMLMKEIVYVYHDDFAWNRSYFPLAAKELEIQFIGGWGFDQKYHWDPEKDGLMADIEDRAKGVINLGHMKQEDFFRQVSLSRVMVGMGWPLWSPSPFNSLCQGVPFLNPVLQWDENDPWNKKKWYSQNPTIAEFDEPYVYHVHRGDYDGFINAIKKASTTPIEPFIPEFMTEKALQGRLMMLMETDWRAEAVVLLKERLTQPGSFTFEI